MITRELFDYYQAGGLETAEELEVTIWPLHWAMTNHQSLCKPNKGHKLSLYTLISNTVMAAHHMYRYIFSRWFYFWGTKRPSQKRSTAHFMMRRWICINTTISIIIFITTIIIIIQVEGLIVPFLCLSDLRIASRLTQFQMVYIVLFLPNCSHECNIFKKMQKAFTHQVQHLYAYLSPSPLPGPQKVTIFGAITILFSHFVNDWHDC